MYGNPANNGEDKLPIQPLVRRISELGAKSVPPCPGRSHDLRSRRHLVDAERCPTPQKKGRYDAITYFVEKGVEETA